MYVTLLAVVSDTKNCQPNVYDTISSSLCHYKLGNLMYVTLLAVVSDTKNCLPNVCDTISNSPCYYNKST